MPVNSGGRPPLRAGLVLLVSLVKAPPRKMRNLPGGGSACAWTGSRPPTFLPAVIGHEIVGVVEELGPEPPVSFEAEPLARGDRVTFSLTASCGRCFYCVEAGLPQKCECLFKYGHTSCEDALPLTGGLGEYVYLVPGTEIFKLPEVVSDEVAATAM